MATYQAYLSTTNSLYTNPIEPTGGDSGNSYMRVGNNSTGAAHFILLQLPADIPSGVTASAASLRLTEYSSSYGSTTSLDVKFSRITGAWTSATKYNALPAYDSGTSVAETFDNAKPSSSNYDFRVVNSYKYSDGYLGGFIYYDTYQGASFTRTISGDVYTYTYISTVYDYYLWHTIDITTIIQDCIDSGNTGIIIYFDTPGDNDTRKYFKSVNNSSNDLRPRLDITYATNPDPTAPTLDSISTITAASKTFGWADATDVVFDSDKLYYEMQLSDDDGSTWGAAVTSAEGASEYTINLKTYLSIEAAQYYYNPIFKIRVRTKTPDYGGSPYYSAYTTSAAFTVDYRITPTAPSIAVDDDEPYEGDTVTFTITRPDTYNTHDSDGNTNMLYYYIQLYTGTALVNTNELVTSATKDRSYYVDDLTVGRSDLSTYVRVYCEDTEGQTSSYSSNLAFTVKRFRTPIINVTGIDRDETVATISVIVSDTGFADAQANTEVNKIQYSLAGGAYGDAALDGWSDLENSFDTSALVAGTRYVLGVKVINEGPGARENKTSSAYLDTILEYTPVTATVRDSVSGMGIFMAQNIVVGEDFTVEHYLSGLDGWIYTTDTWNYKALTNLITNGNFVGTTGWTTARGTISAANNTLTSTGTGGGTSAGVTFGTAAAATSAKKYYARVRARVTNSACTMIRMSVYDTPFAQIKFIAQNTPTINEWYAVSGVVSLNAGTGTIGMGILQFYADSATQTGKVMEVQEVSLIDLTGIYGAGNEPTKAQMDALTATWGVSPILIPTGTSGNYQKGDKVKLTQTTTKYLYVTNVADMALTVTGGSDYTLTDDALSEIYYSHAENPVGFPQWFNHTPTYTGFSADPSDDVFKFCIKGKTCFFYHNEETAGTSNATGFTISLPVTAALKAYGLLLLTQDNSSVLTTPGRWEVAIGATTATLYKDTATGAWTASGTKRAWLSGFYEI